MNNYEYITDYVREHTRMISLFDALDRDEFWIYADNGLWWTERPSWATINNKLYKTLKKEMKRLYPELTWIGETGGVV